MKVHACWRDKECQMYGAPKRLYINGKYGSLSIGARSQAWLPKLGYMPNRWWFITFNPTYKGKK